jgi:hypothetical protein
MGLRGVAQPLTVYDYSNDCWESARGPDDNRDHMLESSLTELVRQWVPEDVGDVHGGDGTLGPETRGRASS